jgi:hypothetical protein
MPILGGLIEGRMTVIEYQEGESWGRWYADNCGG